MSDFLKNFWQDNLTEIRENKIRFGAILILLIATVIFALADSTAADTEIPIETPAAETPAAAVEDTEIQPVQPAAVPAASENLKVVLGANSSALYVSDPFTAPIPEPAPAVEVPAELPEIPVAQIEPEPAEKFALSGTAVSGDSKTAIIHKISGDKDRAENFIVSVGDTLGTRRVIDITPDFVALDDGSKIFFTP